MDDSGFDEVVNLSCIESSSLYHIHDPSFGSNTTKITPLARDTDSSETIHTTAVVAATP